MKISVVIPVYNERDGIDAALSALRLAGPWAEIIVVDASSDDECKKRVTESVNQCAEENLQLLTCSTQGRAVQMNFGAKQATGDAILFLHADTLVPHAAPELIAAVLDNAHAWGRFDVRFDDDRGWLWWVARLMNIRSHFLGIATGDQAIFVHRATFEKLGGYATIPLMEDVKLSRRLKRESKPARIKNPVTTSGRRWRANGYLKTILLMWTLRFAFWVGIPADRLVRWYR